MRHSCPVKPWPWPAGNAPPCARSPLLEELKSYSKQKSLTPPQPLPLWQGSSQPSSSAAPLRTPEARWPSPSIGSREPGKQVPHNRHGCLRGALLRAHTSHSGTTHKMHRKRGSRGKGEAAKLVSQSPGFTGQLGPGPVVTSHQLWPSFF